MSNYRFLKGLAKKICSVVSTDPEHDSEDIMQTCFMRLVESLDRGMWTEPTLALLRWSVIQDAINFNRYTRLRKDYMEPFCYLTGDTEEDSYDLELCIQEVEWAMNAYRDDEQMKELMDCVEKWMFPHLNERQQYILLARMHGDSENDIAETIGCSRATIARDRLKIKDVFYVYWDFDVYDLGEWEDGYKTD